LSCGVGLRFEASSPALIRGPFMYPFATGATGEYFPWLRDSGGRPNTGDGSPCKGRQRRYLVYQSVYFPEGPHEWYLSGSVSTTKPASHQYVSRIGPCNERRSTSIGPVGSCSVAQSLVSVVSFGTGRCQGRMLGLVLLDSVWSERLRIDPCMMTRTYCRGYVRPRYSALMRKRRHSSSNPLSRWEPASSKV
jgi:hypothetical protein